MEAEYEDEREEGRVRGLERRRQSKRMREEEAE